MSDDQEDLAVNTVNSLYDELTAVVVAKLKPLHPDVQRWVLLRLMDEFRFWDAADQLARTSAHPE